MGARMSNVRGALPRDPFAGRMNAAGLMYGSQVAPDEQEYEKSGFFNGTPGIMSSRIARFVPPRRFVSVMNGMNGCPPWRRNRPEMDHPPKAPFTIAGASDSNWRPLPNGRS